MSLRRSSAAATLAGLAALTLAACGSSSPSTPAGDGTITVVASTNVYGSIAEAVGGPGVTVEPLITDPAADPHSYESTPADAARVAEADVVILNGGGYDDFMRDLVAAVGGERAVIDVAELSGFDGGGEFNEHVWYSLATVKTLATQLATDLGAVDAANVAGYAANATAFGTQVDGLVERAAAIGPSVQGGRVAVTEPVPGYLIETAGLANATPDEFAEAIEEDTDPPAAVLQETLALFTPGSPDPVRALILNGQTETPTTDQVRAAAEGAGVPVVEMTETLPADQPDYISWMGAQIDALSAALDPV